MRRVRVHIATTDGPATVQRITAEDPEIRCVVCLDGKAMALPISADYDAFVRRPTGVVEACFGHGAFRVDVSHPITTGLSWELGLFIAHALAAAGRLAERDDDADHVVWVTGEVDRDLKIGGVAEVGLKLARSAATLDAVRAEGVGVTLIVPSANDAEAGDGAVTARTVAEALSALDLRLPKRARRPGGTMAARGRASRARPVLATVAVGVLALGAVIGWRPDGAGDPSVHPTPTERVRVTATETRAASGASCAAVHFGAARAVEKVLSSGAIDHANLCDLRYRIESRATAGLRIWAFAIRADNGAGGTRTRVFHAATPLGPGAALDVDARPPRRLVGSLRQEFVVLSVAADDRDGAAAAGRASGGVEAIREWAGWTALIERARRDGVTVRRLSNEFVLGRGA